MGTLPAPFMAQAAPVSPTSVRTRFGFRVESITGPKILAPGFLLVPSAMDDLPTTTSRPGQALTRSFNESWQQQDVVVVKNFHEKTKLQKRIR